MYIYMYMQLRSNKNKKYFYNHLIHLFIYLFIDVSSTGTPIRTTNLGVVQPAGDQIWSFGAKTQQTLRPACLGRRHLLVIHRKTPAHRLETLGIQGAEVCKSVEKEEMM